MREVSKTRLGQRGSGLLEDMARAIHALGKLSLAVFMAAGLRASASCLTLLEGAVWTQSSQASM